MTEKLNVFINTKIYLLTPNIINTLQTNTEIKQHTQTQSFDSKTSTHQIGSGPV